MIDIHCHILAGLDDGPTTLDESLALARALIADGVATVVATPHIYESTLPVAQIESRLAELRRQLSVENLKLEILAGGENHYNVPLQDMALYTIHAGRYLLLEFPPDGLPPSAGEIVFSLRSQGLVPIITHPERNGAVLRDPLRLQPLLEQGALAQLTAASLLGDFGTEVRQCARYLLKKDMIHFLATDAHGAGWRVPRLKAGLAEAVRLIGCERARSLVEEHPHRVIVNQPWCF
jgi:protein-tyrosine phosphatase